MIVMTLAYIVICDQGILPWYITLGIYLIVMVLVHFYVIRYLLRYKVKIAEKIAKFMMIKDPKIMKTVEVVIENVLPVIVFAGIMILMICSYPIITSSNCPHNFWRIFGKI